MTTLPDRIVNIPAQEITFTIPARVLTVPGYDIDLEHEHDYPEPEPEPDPEPDPPLPEKEVLDSAIWVKNKPGIVFENIIVPGRLTLKNCPGAIIRNVTCLGNDGTENWGHLNLVDSPGTVVTDYMSRENKRGHGIHLAGDVNDILIQRADCDGMEEDGLQCATTADGSYRVEDSMFTGAFENGVDLKGASGYFLRCLIDCRPGQNEPFLTHQNHVFTTLEGCTLVDNQYNKALGRVHVGGAEVLNCELISNPDFRGFRTEGEEFSVQDMLDGIDVPWLTVEGAYVG